VDWAKVSAGGGGEKVLMGLFGLQEGEWRGSKANRTTISVVKKRRIERTRVKEGQRGDCTIERGPRFAYWKLSTH